MNANNITVTNETVQSDVGICYFDPIDETIKEIGSSYILSSNSYGTIVHKLMVAVSSKSLSKVSIKLVESEDLSSKLDIKLLPGAVTPSYYEFDNVPSYNSININGPLQPYSLIPFFIHIKAKSDIVAISNLPLEVSYEL